MTQEAAKTRRRKRRRILKRAMVLAAGLGTRLRPLTEKLPKPLIKIGGRTLIDHAIDRLVDAGVETIVVNLHHLGHLIEGHLRHREDVEILFSHEDEILETGGGVKKALPLLGDEPFFVANSDVLWLNGPGDALLRMAKIFDSSRMDALLLMHSTVTAFGYDGMGDFCVDPDGALQQRPERELSPYLFSGVQVLHKNLFRDSPEGAFRLRELYDRAIEEGRLHGVIHDGEWFHVGTPEGLSNAELYMRVRYLENVKRH